MSDIDVPDVEHQAPSIASLARRALRPTSPAEAEPAIEAEPTAAPAADALVTDEAEPTPVLITDAPEESVVADSVVADSVVADSVVADASAAETPVAETPVADAPTAGAKAGRGESKSVALRSDRSRLVTALLSGLVALALVFAAISGVVWWRAGHGGSSREAKARDAVLLQVHLDLATLNTLDYRAVDAGLARWAAVTTGTLHAGIVDASAATKSVITKAKTVTKAVVLDAAVTALNLGKGSATVIASIQVTKTPDTGSAVVDRNRVSATMSLVHGVWRVSDLQGVLVQLS